VGAPQAQSEFAPPGVHAGTVSNPSEYGKEVMHCEKHFVEKLIAIKNTIVFTAKIQDEKWF
jgi:hypothetical protein